MPLFLISLVWPLPRRVSLPTLREGLDDGAIDQDLLGLPGHKVRAGWKSRLWEVTGAWDVLLSDLQVRHGDFDRVSRRRYDVETVKVGAEDARATG